MNKILSLSKRSIKEIVREPISLILCLGFPLVMLAFMTLIFKNMEFVPQNFQITSYANGICVFGYTFTSLFIAMQIASDKNSSFIKRINISPINKGTYYLSFFLSALPIVLVQTVLFFLVALIFGYPFNAKLILNIVYLLPSAIFYILIGILIGSICKNEKQTGPISSIFISFTGIFGGVFMPLETLSEGFYKFVNIMPFCHTVLIGSEVQTVGASCIYPHIIYLIFYIAIMIAVIAIIEKVRSIKY